MDAFQNRSLPSNSPTLVQYALGSLHITHVRSILDCVFEGEGRVLQVTFSVYSA